MKVDVKNDAGRLTTRLNRASTRVQQATKEVMRIHSGKIAQHAKEELDRITKGTGDLANTIGYEVQGASDKVTSTFTWGRRYGHILEYGPTKKEWTIEARYARALRFPILSNTGSVERIMYVPRGRKVLHVWTEDQKRPHFKPALEKDLPELRKELSEIIERIV